MFAEGDLSVGLEGKTLSCMPIVFPYLPFTHSDLKRITSTLQTFTISTTSLPLMFCCHWTRPENCDANLIHDEH